MLLPLALLMAALISYQLLWSVKISRYYKLLLILLISAAALKSQIVYLFGGDNYFAPDLPGWVILSAAWFYAESFFSFILLLFPAAATFCAKIHYKFKKTALPEKFRYLNNIVNIVLMTLAVILASVALANGLREPEVRKIELFLNKLPQTAENYRMTVLSDLHIDRASSPAKVRKLVERVNRLQSNTVVILGDVVDGRTSTLSESVRELEKLRAADGVYGIMGNHEYFSGGSEWADFLTQCNIKMLLNENVELRENFYLAGITDPAARRSKDTMEKPDLEKALRNIAPEACTVLLAHRPGHAREAVKKNVQLQLSGHTHGGMIAGFDRVIGKFNEGFTAGAYQLEDMLLYVSSGTAIWSGFPFRLGSRAEITVITLKNNNLKIQGKEK